MIIQHNLTLDVTVPDTVLLHDAIITTGDTVHQLVIQLINIDASQISHATINLVRPDGIYVTANVVDLDDNVASYNLTTTDLAVSGHLLANLHLHDIDGNRMATPAIAIAVQADLANLNAIESVQQYTVLQDLIKKVEGLGGVNLDDINLSPATPDSDGLMTASDKAKLDSLQAGDFATASDLESISNRLDAVATNVDDIDGDIDIITEEMRLVNNNINMINGDIIEIDNNIAEINSDIASVVDNLADKATIGDLATVQDEMEQIIDDRITSVQNDMQTVVDNVDYAFSTFAIPKRTANPVNPIVGQMWIITGGDA